MNIEKSTNECKSTGTSVGINMRVTQKSHELIKRRVSKSAAYISKVWSPDNGDGTYTNPVLYADYSDPDVICVEHDFYMTASSFTSIPGLPILHSKDLVNWTLIAHALGRYPQDAFNLPQHAKGVWAPAIRYHNNMFYIYWGDPDAGIYMVRSQTPEGPWQEPVLVLPGRGLIDSCPLWDEDGSAWLIHGWAGSRAGVKSLLTLHPMNPEGTRADPNGKHIFDGHDDHPTIEGPKFYKRNGYYYILAPAGGVKTGWQLALRSKNIEGPYETKIVLQQGDAPVNGPHQGGWVQTPTGQSWFLHFQDLEAYGRVVHLQPVTWQDEWPMMGQLNDKTGLYEPVLTAAKPETIGPNHAVNPVESDEFDTDQLGLQWQWQANPQLTWYALMPDTSYLRLFAHKLPHNNASLWDAPNLLLQKFPAPDFTATTKLKLTPEASGRQAGLVIMGSDYACLSLTSAEQGLTISQKICTSADQNGQEKIIEEAEITHPAVYLRVKITSPDAVCTFSYSLDGKEYKDLGTPFHAKPGGWVGAKIGLYCLRDYSSEPGGYADFDWFRID